MFVLFFDNIVRVFFQLFAHRWPGPDVGEAGGGGERQDGVQERFGCPYSGVRDGEPNEVDLLLGKLELGGVEDDAVNGTPFEEAADPVELLLDGTAHKSKNLPTVADWRRKSD